MSLESVRERVDGGILYLSDSLFLLSLVDEAQELFSAAAFFDDAGNVQAWLAKVRGETNV